MDFAATLSTHPEPAVAAGEILGEIRDKLTAAPDLAVVFSSGGQIGSLPEMVDATHCLLMPHTLLAVTASGTIAGAEEVETGNSFSVWAGQTGDLTAVRLEMIPGSEPIIAGLPTFIEPGSILVLCAEPFTFDVTRLIAKLETDHPGVLLCGGIASAANAPGINRLWLDENEFSDGAVGVIFPPGVATPMVSQGCRPIGRPWVITAGNTNIIRSLGGAPALTRLRETVAALDPVARRLASRGLQIGFAASDHHDDPRQGDFLIRGIQGADSSTGAVAVGALVQVGQLVQFQLRDPAVASEDLTTIMAREKLSRKAEAALLFTCNGRGTHMFAVPNHDAAIVSDYVGSAVGGMFCAGELGPVAGHNAVHTFTATALLFGR